MTEGNNLLKIGFYPKAVETRTLLRRWIQMAGMRFPNLPNLSPVTRWRMLPSALVGPFRFKFSGKTSRETRHCFPKAGIVVRRLPLTNGLASACSKAVDHSVVGKAHGEGGLTGGTSSVNPTVPGMSLMRMLRRQTEPLRPTILEFH